MHALMQLYLRPDWRARTSALVGRDSDPSIALLGLCSSLTILRLEATRSSLRRRSYAGSLATEPPRRLSRSPLRSGLIVTARWKPAGTDRRGGGRFLISTGSGDSLDVGSSTRDETRRLRGTRFLAAWTLNAVRQIANASTSNLRSCSAAARLTSRVRCKALCHLGKMDFRMRCLSYCMPRTMGVRSSMASKTLKRRASSRRRATSSAWRQV